MDQEHKVSKTVETADGSKVTVTVTSSEPINAEEYFILGDDRALREMGEHLASLAKSIEPPE